MTWVFRYFKLICCLALIASSLGALDMEAAKETACFPIKQSVAPDLNWVMSQKDWKYLYGSRLDVYMAGIEQSGKSAEELTEEELYNDMCLIAVMNEGKFTTSGFNGLKIDWGMKPVKGMEIMEFYLNNGELAGTIYITFTDNETFMVMPACWVDGQMSWAVLSPMDHLPDETVLKIHKHLESLGFSKEFFTGDLFKNCRGKSAKSKVEL